MTQGALTPGAVTFAIVNPAGLFELPASERAEPELRVVEAAEARIDVHDLGFLRGDGVFEATRVIGGRAVSLADHLRRLDRSLELLDLPRITSKLGAWRETIERLVAERATGDELWFLRILVSRGVEASVAAGDDTPTVRLLLRPAPDLLSETDATGLTAALFSREFSSEAAARSPWLLIGAKTLSYASNMAAIRHAKCRGAELAIFHTSDGLLLEGTNSSIVLRYGDELRTPHPRVGILHGTTQRELFRYAAGAGLRVRQDDIPLAELSGADSAFTLGGGTIRAISRLGDDAFAVDHELLAGVRAFIASKHSYDAGWADTSEFPLG